MELEQFNTVSLAAPKYDKPQNAKPMPSKKQLLKRKSFGSAHSGRGAVLRYRITDSR